MELGQDLKSYCNHSKAICTHICETFDGCFSLRSVPFIGQRLCRNQFKFSALFTRDEILEHKPFQTLLKNLGPVLY